jgi:hypothetical protein
MGDWRDELVKQLEQQLGGNIKFGRDSKFDLQWTASTLKECRLAKVIAFGEFDTFELKSETFIWRRTGNIAIEYRRDGKPSGIAVTKATWWVHELCDDDGATVVYLMMPMPRLKAIARAALEHSDCQGGDRNATSMVRLNISDLLRVNLPERQ